MIEEVKKIFDDIRDGIIEMGGDISVCTSPEEYAKAIKGLSGNNAVIFIPCFKASDTKPETPTKEMSPADPTDYPEGGGTPDGLTGKIWMTYTIVSVSTVYVPGTEPVLLGVAGESPIPLVYEPQVTRTFVICMELPEAEIIPNIPTGGKGDVDNNILLGTIEYPSAQYTIESILSNGNTAGWSCNNTHVSGGFTWMSVGTFLAEDGSQVGSGSDPMCINSARDGVDGHDGRNGVDGTDVEFIYMLLARNEDPARILAPPSDPDRDGDVPVTGHVPDGTDHPTSIDRDNYPVEIMCQRKKNKDTGKGGPFVGPVVWSSWGEDGMDGDGVEYIFRVATNAEVTQDANGKFHLNDIAKWPPTCGDDCANAFYTVAAGHGYTREKLTEMYQRDDWVPDNSAYSIGWDRNWTDDPRDVDINEPFEFVSIRKYDGESGTGGWFSTPVLWNKYYVTSAPIFTSYAFCRSTKNLGSMTLSGGTVLNPLPSDQTVDGELIHWYDGIPGAAEYGAESTRAKAPIGMTSSKFGSADPTVVIAPDGTSPVLMADSKFFNVEYSASDTFTTPLPKFDAYLPGVVSGKDYPFIDNADSEGVDEATGRSYCTSHGYGTGGDTVTNPKGMATCTFEDGHGTDGTVTQIEGEDGQDGQDGNDGNDGRGISSITIYYMGYNSGTSHPAADAQGGSSSIPSAPSDQTYKYLGKKTITTYTSSPLTETTYELISERGTRGPIGPKMRMRNWKTDYPNPDTEGQTGWLNGNGENDAFYDIAIYPIADEGITVTNASSNADRLGRCIQPLPYTTLATIISQAGDASLVYPGSTYLQGYFSQAVGWDFVATSLLLANRITADQIDVRGISTDTLVTTPEQDDPDSYIRAQGNNMILYKTGNPSCIITGDPLTTDASDTVTKVGENPLGSTFVTSTTQNGVHFTTSLGQFRIVSPEQGQSADYLFSVEPQFISARVDGTLTDTVSFASNQMAFFSHLYLNAINIDTGQIAGTGMTGGYIESLPYSTTSQTSFGPGLLQTGALFKLDTTQHFELQPGLYRLELTGDIITGWNPSLVTNYTFTIGQIKDSLPSPQNSKIAYGGGWHSPIAVHHTSTVNPQTTEIASDGFAHVLSSNNYFKLRHPIDNVGGVDTPDPNTLLMEFRATDPNDPTKAFGLKVDKTGIYKGVYNAGTLQTGDGVLANI